MFTITDHKPFILYTIFNKYQLGFGPEREKIFFLQPNLVFFLHLQCNIFLIFFNICVIYMNYHLYLSLLVAVY